MNSHKPSCIFLPYNRCDVSENWTINPYPANVENKVSS